MKYNDYRQEIYFLDMQIKTATDPDEKIALIDKNIELNKQYIHVLRRPLAVKTVFCIILSIFFLLGLMIFLPQIIVRKNKAEACERRIRYLTALRMTLVPNGDKPEDDA